VRPAVPSDAPLVAALHARCSPAARRSRFLSPTPRLAPGELEALLGIGVESGQAVLAVTTDGGLPIQTTKLSVRSSVVSGVGVVLMVGALAFLALWWGWDIHRRRKRRVRDDAVGATAPLPA